jgi:hypothetical protein
MLTQVVVLILRKSNMPRSFAKICWQTSESNMRSSSPDHRHNVDTATELLALAMVVKVVTEIVKVLTEEILMAGGTLMVEGTLMEQPALMVDLAMVVMVIKALQPLLQQVML